ncbi:unnamed protein product [Timema podura]|uniref:REJ domain-containing protein n=1 Tax=Timema podura TaxID=61482 RepID=A0ABN7PND7_TIMPD|nr:unnamed protein product [Timema podura]
MLGTSSQEVTYLKVLCLSSCPPDIEYTWSLKASPNNTKQSLDWDTETQHGRNSDKLIINQDVLMKGESYTFTVTGKSPDDRASTGTSLRKESYRIHTPAVNDISHEPIDRLSSASIRTSRDCPILMPDVVAPIAQACLKVSCMFHTGGKASLESTAEKEVQVKSGPKLGTCKVEPPTGYSARTKFNITCTRSSQEDLEDQDLHLNYEFYQSHTSEDDQDSLGVLLYYKTLPQALNIFLKSGMKDLDYKTNINVRVSDQNGKFGVSTLQLRVRELSLAQHYLSV